MNLRSLEYFLIAAEELNFTRASERLFITQQALSSHIKRLEEEYLALCSGLLLPACSMLRGTEG